MLFKGFILCFCEGINSVVSPLASPRCLAVGSPIFSYCSYKYFYHTLADYIQVWTIRSTSNCLLILCCRMTQNWGPARRNPGPQGQMGPNPPVPPHIQAARRLDREYRQQRAREREQLLNAVCPPPFPPRRFGLRLVFYFQKSILRRSPRRSHRPP